MPFPRVSHRPAAVVTPCPRRRPHPALAGAVAAVVWFGTGDARLAAQGFEMVRPPVGLQGGIVPGTEDATDDVGRPARMLESTSVDRFVRAAKDLLARDDHVGAIRILQDVIEGRTVEEPTGDVRPEDEVSEAPAQTGQVWDEHAESAESAVFSADGRLFHPVRRLCHELLADLPPVGVAWYRAQHEVAAEQALAAAAAARDPLRFEAVYETWFLTLAAGRAMRAAGDLQMDAGRFRAAIRAYRLLLDVYPAAARQELGIDESWVRFRLATCLRLLGEGERAREEIEQITVFDPAATLRVEGELVRLADLGEELGAAHGAGAASPGQQASTGDVVALRSGQESLTPLFELRFREPAPYRAAKGQARNERVVFRQGGQDLTATPRSGDLAPGTQVAFGSAGELAFLDHFRLGVVSMPGGKLVGRTDGVDEVPQPQPGSPRHRIPAYDFASLRPVIHGGRIFSVVGPSAARMSGMRAVTENALEARAERGGMELLWTTRERAAYRDTTFLAAPTPVGERLLVPVSIRGTHGVACVDGQTGDLVWTTPLHRDGTEMSRPPAVPVSVAGGVAFAVTNAGALAALDAYTGALRWVRRYERVDPFRPPAATRRPRPRTNVFGGGSFFQELPLEGFAPSDLVVQDGLVIHAPTDGQVLIALDGASGEPVWMLERGTMQYLIGHDRDHLYLGGPDDVTCVGLRTGVRLWREILPAHPGSSRWRGRGCVAGGRLLMPGDRTLLVRDLRAGAEWRTIPLPTFQPGREPLRGECNLFFEGPYLVAAYAGGLEAYSTPQALDGLSALAADPIEKAALEAQAGDLEGAVEALESIDLEARPELRAAVGQRLVTLCGELALARAARGSRGEAVSMLDRCRPMLTDDRLIERWHLARIEVFEALGDLEAIAAEQQELYRRMGRSG